MFGMCCLRQDNILEPRYFKVDKRDRETLLPIIVQEIEPETTNKSDEWRAYSTLKDHGFLHQTINHSENFIDLRTGAQTQTIECLWKHMKVKYGIRARGATNLLE